ncbi:MAG: bifunctional 5,10-methylenetetrahydrofolate dehydrogenase/5,10-methenyltetrahydrofolate cyclohydrolase [Bacilli bacterium]|nr:bifunctional 5,10-methylenetetrahydrofolate dehydrogenase/5,10-methenyltetrahydrofolate cyclohydrolase [Bacilli bacterium]
MTVIIDGKKISLKIKEKLKQEIANLKNKPTLAVIQIGNNEASNSYIRAKEKVAQEIGINFIHLKYLEDIEEQIIINKINELNMNKDITGIIIQLPIPKKFNTNKIINNIHPTKDVDGLTYKNIGKLIQDIPSLISCTPKGIMRLLDEYKIDIKGKNIVVVGRSNLVGKPIAQLLLNRDATVTVCHSHTKNLSFYTKQADILIVAVGKKHLITKDMVKEESVIIEVGINKEDNNLYGDVDFDNVKDIASYITPVPGGVGPMTVMMLMENVVKCLK